VAGAAACAALGFLGEIGALQRGEASVVTPVYRALQTVIPIACAPLIFGEHWPAAIAAQGLLVGGIALTLGGIVVVSRHHEGVVRAYAHAPAAG
jgi:drug/metabolite transporter (DMT)-like permease